MQLWESQRLIQSVFSKAEGTGPLALVFVTGSIDGQCNSPFHKEQEQQPHFHFPTAYLLTVYFHSSTIYLLTSSWALCGPVPGPLWCLGLPGIQDLFLDYPSPARCERCSSWPPLFGPLSVLPHQAGGQATEHSLSRD